MYIIGAVVLVVLALIGLVDVYFTGNEGAGTVTGLLFTAAVCVGACQLANSVLTALSMIVILGLIVGLIAPPELRKFARKRKAARR